MDPVINLALSVTFAARLALGHGGMSREDVTVILEDIARAIRTEDCAENMSPIHGDDF